jgi:hypothetical protein
MLLCGELKPQFIVFPRQPGEYNIKLTNGEAVGKGIDATGCSGAKSKLNTIGFDG